MKITLLRYSQVKGTPLVLTTSKANLPPVSTTPVVHLELRISPWIFKKIWNYPNGILRGLGKLMREGNVLSQKNLVALTPLNAIIRVRIIFFCISWNLKSEGLRAAASDVSKILLYNFRFIYILRFTYAINGELVIRRKSSKKILFA